ncbi:MAG: low temperature requirement protein A [Bacteroidales bacterium]
MPSSVLRPISLFSNLKKHRHASWMELFIDLGFVIALSSLESVFEKGINFHTVLIYIFLFFTVLWVWNRLTWYSSYYGNDDLLYRICYSISLFLILGFSAAIPRIETGGYRELIYWYLGIEVLLVLLWGRVLLSTKEFRKNNISFFLSYLTAFLIILFSLFMPLSIQLPLWLTAIFIEMIGPIIGWKREKGNISVHTPHILERHGLFMIILLGEGLISVLTVLKHSFDFHSLLLGFLILCILTLLWWLFFNDEYEEWTNLSQHISRTFIYGYGQFVIFIAILLIIFSFNLNIHSTGDSHNSESILNASRILLFATGVYLFSLGFIQLLISDLKKLNPIYRFRIYTGIALLILSSYPWNNFLLAVLISFFILTGCLIHQYMVRRRIERKNVEEEIGSSSKK